MQDAGKELGDPALCESHPVVTPQYYCRLGGYLCFLYVCVFIVLLYFVFAFSGFSLLLCRRSGLANLPSVGAIPYSYPILVQTIVDLLCLFCVYPFVSIIVSACVYFVIFVV